MANRQLQTVYTIIPPISRSSKNGFQRYISDNYRMLDCETSLHHVVYFILSTKYNLITKIRITNFSTKRVVVHVWFSVNWPIIQNTTFLSIVSSDLG